jgi:hypothetical protein
MVASEGDTPARGRLEGENIETEHWEDARHWMSIYDDLIRFKIGLLERVKRELAKLYPVARSAADVDIAFIEAQMAGYHARLDLWYRRVWQLQGLWLDPNGRVVHHKGEEAALTVREFELLQFLLEHRPPLLPDLADRQLCVVGRRPDARGGAQLRHPGPENPGSPRNPLRPDQPTGSRLLPDVSEH